MTDQPSPAAELANLRWAKATEEERKKQGQKLLEGRVKARSKRKKKKPVKS